MVFKSEASPRKSTQENLLEKELLSLDITKYEVETLSETIDHPPYIPTRAFYEKMGFKKGEAREIISVVSGEKLELVTYCKNLRQE